MAYVLGADALPSTLVGGAIVAVSAAIQARLSFEREEQWREDEEKWFELRMVLNQSRDRLLRQDEALSLVAALATIGDSNLDGQIRSRVMSDLPAAWTSKPIEEA